MADEIRKTPEENPQEEPVEKIDLGASLRKEHKQKKPVNRVAVIAGLAVAIIAAVGLAVILPKVIKGNQDAETQSLTVNLSSHEADDVVRIKVEGENTFEVTKDESAVYHMSLFADGQVNQSTCSSAFTNAAQMQADQLVEANAADLSVYGLDTPSSTLTVEYTDETMVLELGDVLSVTGQVYCRKQGESDVYALRAYFAEIFGGSILRYRGLSLPETSTDILDSRSIIIRQKGQEQIRFLPIENETSAATGTWKMTEPKELWLDTGAVAELVEGISSYKLYGYEGKFDDLAQFGLNDPWFTVIMSDVNGNKRTLSLGNINEEESRYYCTVDDSGEVFTISTTYTGFAEDFKVSYYIDNFANIVSIAAVDQVTVTDGKKAYEMTIERQEQFDEDGNLKKLANGKPDYLETYRLNGAEQQEDAFKKSYQAVIGVTISNLAEEKLVDAAQPPVLTITYTLNTGSAPMTVEYLPYDINNYCIRKDGSINLICKKELVDAIMTTLDDLQAGKLNKAE